MNHTTLPPICAPRARCRRWRTCPACAALRQRTIADAAERLHSIEGRTTWATIQADHAGAAAIRDLRQKFLDANKPTGAVWTIEQSPTTGNLHCNVLIPGHEPSTRIAGTIFTAPLHGNPRHVGAYISKPAQFPDTDAFPGRIYGTAGPLWQWLTSGGQMPTIQAAAAQWEIDPTPAPRRPRPPVGIDPATAREIAAHYLPDILPPTRDRRPD